MLLFNHNMLICITKVSLKLGEYTVNKYLHGLQKFGVTSVDLYSRPEQGTNNWKLDTKRSDLVCNVVAFDIHQLNDFTLNYSTLTVNKSA